MKIRAGLGRLEQFPINASYLAAAKWSGKNHLGDHTEALPTAHGFQGY
jgi:hypothetical protein